MSASQAANPQTTDPNIRDLWKTARLLIRDLENPLFEKKPHAGIVGPRNVRCRDRGGLISYIEEDDEFEGFTAEELEEDIFTRPIPDRFGFWISLEGERADPVGEEVDSVLGLDLSRPEKTRDPRDIILKLSKNGLLRKPHIYVYTSFIIRLRAPRTKDCRGERGDEFRHIGIRNYIFSDRTVTLIEVRRTAVSGSPQNRAPSGSEGENPEPDFYHACTVTPGELIGALVKITDTGFSDTGRALLLRTDDLEPIADLLTTPDDAGSALSTKRTRRRKRSGRGNRAREPLPSELHYTHSFSVTVEIQDRNDGKKRFYWILRNEGGHTDERQNRHCDIHPVYIKDSSGNTWETGIFMRTRTAAYFRGVEATAGKTGNGFTDFMPIGGTYYHLREENGRVASLSVDDMALAVEEITQNPPARSDLENDIYSSIPREYREIYGEDTVREVSSIVAEALREYKREIGGLYEFQKEAIRKILSGALSAEDNAVSISARTAGGKTLAFFLPILIYTLLERLAPKHTDRMSVKALMMYPTKALIHDQASGFLKIIYHVNTQLERRGHPPVRIGIYHGDTPRRSSIDDSEPFEIDMRYQCPICGRSRLFYTENGVRCGNGSCRVNTDSTVRERIERTVTLFDEDVLTDVPDILITVPEKLLWRFLLDPNTHVLLGRRARRCTVCGYPSVNLRARKCPREGCSGDLGDEVHGHRGPKFIVFDEAHQLRGSFGSQVAHLTTRIINLIHRYCGEDHSVVTVFSSATIPSLMEQYIDDFFGRRIPRESVQARESQQIGVGEPRRVHVYLTPDSYTPPATLVHILRVIFSQFIRNHGRKPRILIFTNRISDTNNLVNTVNNNLTRYLRNTVQNITVDGHTTDYGKERSNVEDRFSRGEIDVLVATKGLEVGVDFSIIDALIIYGAPFNLSDYVQRIGRAGRTRPALVIHIYLDNPSDYHYYANRYLTVEEPHRRTAIENEIFRVRRDNPEIMRRSAIAAVLEYVAYGNPGLYSGSHGVITQKLEEILLDNEEPKPELTEFMANAMNISQSDARNIGEKAINEIVSVRATNQRRSLSNMADIARTVIQSKKLRNLRSSSETAKVRFRDLIKSSGQPESREKDISVVLRNYLQGDAVSYRGFYFIVEDIIGGSASRILSRYMRDLEENGGDDE